MAGWLFEVKNAEKKEKTADDGTAAVVVLVVLAILFVLLRFGADTHVSGNWGSADRCSQGDQVHCGRWSGQGAPGSEGRSSGHHR